MVAGLTAPVQTVQQQQQQSSNSPPSSSSAISHPASSNIIGAPTQSAASYYANFDRANTIAQSNGGTANPTAIGNALSAGATPEQAAAMATGSMAPAPTVTIPLQQLAASGVLNSVEINALSPDSTTTVSGQTYTKPQLQQAYDYVSSQIAAANPALQTSEEQTAATDRYLESYAGQQAQQQPVTLASPGLVAVPVAAPTFSATNNQPALQLPQGWNVDSTGNIAINGVKPTPDQSYQFGLAYANYLGWLSQNPDVAKQLQQTSNAPITTPNWYSAIQKGAGGASGGVVMGQLAEMQYMPIPPTVIGTLQETTQTGQRGAGGASGGVVMGQLAEMKYLPIPPTVIGTLQGTTQTGQRADVTSSLLPYSQPAGLSTGQLSVAASLYPNLQGTNPSALISSQPSHIASTSQPYFNYSNNPYTATTISQGGIPTGLATQGEGLLSPLLITSPFLAGSNEQNNPQFPTQAFPLEAMPSTQNIQTSQIPSSWSKFFSTYPSAVGSTLGGIANWAITPPSYVQGGTPLAGGQFPTNYPYTLKVINTYLNSPNPQTRNLGTILLNQYTQLAMQSQHAYPQTMTNQGYQYLGSPSPSGDVLTYLESPAGLAKQAALGGATLGLGATAIAAPAAFAAGTLILAGTQATVNPLFDYLYLGGEVTPQQMAQASAQGLVYGGLTGGIPGLQGLSAARIALTNAAMGGVGGLFGWLDNVFGGGATGMVNNLSRPTQR